VDHLVLTVADLDRTCRFYQETLGFEMVTFAGNRRALTFGRQNINLQRVGEEFEPKALRPTTGSGDWCSIATTPLETVIEELRAKNVFIEEAPWNAAARSKICVQFTSATPIRISSRFRTMTHKRGRQGQIRLPLARKPRVLEHPPEIACGRSM
jgi:catechol 2,3-dioxygenase-like lactoylglutathione lyase family enzyme